MAKAPGNVAETVKDVRRPLGISQEELAYELGVSILTIKKADPFFGSAFLFGVSSWKNGHAGRNRMACSFFLAHVHLISHLRIHHILLVGLERLVRVG